MLEVFILHRVYLDFSESMKSFKQGPTGDGFASRQVLISLALALVSTVCLRQVVGDR